MSTEITDDPVHAAIPERSTDATSLDRSEENSTQSLYKAAIGSSQTDYYSALFTRFDTADRVGISWNWAAALLTLNWMAYRQLWGAALAYAGAMVSTVLLVFGIGRLVFQLGSETETALLLALLTLSVVLPGMYGNALLYAQSRKRMERALASNTTLPEACAMLRQQASGRQRLIWLALANVALAGAIGAAVLALPEFNALPLQSEKMALAREHTASAPVAAPVPATPVVGASAQGAVVAMPAASAASAVASAPAVAAAAASAPIRAASAPASASAPAPAQATASAPATASAKAASAAVAPALATSAQAGQGSRGAQGKIQNSLLPALPPLKAASAEVPRSQASAASAAKVPAAKTPPPAAHAVEKSAPKGPAVATPKATKVAKAASAPAANAVAHDSGFMINVGLFAQDNNALNAFTKLKDADLPALTQVLNTAKGKRTRVRVGPYATRAEADAAAEKIRALQLDAIVFQQ